MVPFLLSWCLTKLLPDRPQLYNVFQVRLFLTFYQFLTEIAASELYTRLITFDKPLALVMYVL